MAATDWTTLDDMLDDNSVKKLATAGIVRPNGGGGFVLGFRSLVSTEGVSGYFVDLSGVNPTAANKGGSVRGAVNRYAGSGLTDYAAFLAIGVQGSNPPSVNDIGYLLGLSDDNPSRIVLRKGTLVGGLPAGAVGASGILRRSNKTVAVGTWVHLRLDMVVNLNGDVYLRCFESDLNAHAVTSPTWAAIAGMDDFLDDGLGLNSGSLPLTSGFIGVGHYSKGINRTTAFDQIEAISQD